MKTLNMILTIGLLSFSMITKGQWNQVSGFSNDLLHATHFTDTNTGYIACDRGMIIKTQNGGLSWDTVQTLFNFSWFLDIHFPSTNTGYACGGTAFGPHKNVVVKTTNAGLSWDSLTANDFGGYGFSTLFFVNDSIGFIAGDTVIKTTDGGSSFSPIAISPDISDYRSIHFPSDSIGYIAGFIFTGNKNIAQIFKTNNQGQNWSLVYSDTSLNGGFINSIYFIDNINGYGVGDNGLFLRTTDGGNTWSKSFIAQNPIILTKIQFINQSTGFITAANYGKKIGYIFKTIDGGSNWNVATVDTSGVLLDIYMISTDTGYAIGHEKVFKTTNGGNTGINDDKPDNIFDIKIYPNPTSSQINIQLKNLENQDVELTIMNILGEVIYEEMFHNVEGELNKIYALSQLSNGIYFIKIGLDERIFVNKIIIQK